MHLEQEGFGELIAGSDIIQHEINRLAATNYLTAEEAFNRKLVASLL
jgi:hypothetical protein